MGNIVRFITHQLKLKVNETKSAVAQPQERKFLGFSLQPAQRSSGSLQRRPWIGSSDESVKSRDGPRVGIQRTIGELASYVRGWRSYFGFCETPEVLDYLTRWVRLRLRAALWRQWKTPRRRPAALLALGVRPRLASNTAGSGRDPWYPSKSKALSVGAF